eukprot:PITA_07404
MEKVENSPVATRTLKRKREDLLPPHVNPLRHTLVLDMDHTLLAERCHKVPKHEGSEYFKVMRTRDGKERKKYVYQRPGLQSFLTEMSELGKKRANRFLDEIDTDRQLIKFRLYRDSAKHGVKDLSRLGRDLRKVIIIDDKSESYQLQQSNAIPIKRFDGLKSDSELTQLIPLLQNLSKVDDVRPELADKFKVHDPPVTDVLNAKK